MLNWEIACREMRQESPRVVVDQRWMGWMMGFYDSLTFAGVLFHHLGPKTCHLQQNSAEKINNLPKLLEFWRWFVCNEDEEELQAVQLCKESGGRDFKGQTTSCMQPGTAGENPGPPHT